MDAHLKHNLKPGYDSHGRGRIVHSRLSQTQLVRGVVQQRITPVNASFTLSTSAFERGEGTSQLTAESK